MAAIYALMPLMPPYAAEADLLHAMLPLLRAIAVTPDALIDTAP